MIRYLETFFRNRWIIGIPALILLFGSIGSAVVFTPEKYDASARVWTERSAYLDAPGFDNQYLTPAQVQSNRLKELVSTVTFTRAIVDRIFDGQPVTEDQKLEIVEEIQDGLTVWDTGEHSVHVGFSSTDPQLTLQIIEFAIDQYNRVSAASANTQAEAAIGFYQERVRVYEEEILPKSEKSVQDYLEANPDVRRNIQEEGPLDPRYELLQQQAADARAEYQRYQQRLDEVMVQSAAAQKNQESAFRVMDPPTLLPGGGTLSKKTLLIYAGISTIVSLGYAALFLLLATELDQTLRHAQDVRRRLNLPVLEVVPDFARRRNISSRLLTRPKKRGSLHTQQAQASPKG